jgi:hypothetical protein
MDALLGEGLQVLKGVVAVFAYGTKMFMQVPCDIYII